MLPTKQPLIQTTKEGFTIPHSYFLVMTTQIKNEREYTLVFDIEVLCPFQPNLKSLCSCPPPCPEPPKLTCTVSNNSLSSTFEDDSSNITINTIKTIPKIEEEEEEPETNESINRYSTYCTCCRKKMFRCYTTKYGP